MGLFDFLGLSKTNYLGEMREYLKHFMLGYIKDFPEASDVVMPIFSNANEMLKESSENEIRKSTRQNKVNIECGVLNIVQNFAMTELKPKSAVEFIKNTDDHALNLYKYVNDLKYKKGYISKQQYDENALLATKLSVNAPLGSWF